MKYIRTPFTIFEVVEETDIIYRVKAKGDPHNIYSKSKCRTDVVKSADTIEELCDKFVYIGNDGNFIDSHVVPHTLYMIKNENVKVYGAIWTNKGLIYVAKMNDKGELELL